MLSIDPNEIDSSNLRAWLFKTYTLCGDYEAYDNLNNRIKETHNYAQSFLQNKSIELRASVFTQREE